MFGLGTMELVIILLIVVMVFGVGKLPLVAKQLGTGIRAFQKSVRGDDEEEARRLTGETASARPVREGEKATVDKSS